MFLGWLIVNEGLHFASYEWVFHCSYYMNEYFIAHIVWMSFFFIAHLKEGVKHYVGLRLLCWSVYHSHCVVWVWYCHGAICWWGIQLLLLRAVCWWVIQLLARRVCWWLIPAARPQEVCWWLIQLLLLVLIYASDDEDGVSYWETQFYEYSRKNFGVSFY